MIRCIARVDGSNATTLIGDFPAADLPELSELLGDGELVRFRSEGQTTQRKCIRSEFVVNPGERMVYEFLYERSAP